MAQKKKTTKTKKLHPGGSVPANRLSRQPKPLSEYDPRIDKRDVGVPGGMKGFRERQRERLSRVPKTGMTKVKTRQEDITAQQRANRRALRFIRQRQKMMNEARRRFGQPTMPTAGISQGRPIRGGTPMPGPAPDSERMKRMQKLMREQQKRYNEFVKSQAKAGTPGMRTMPVPGRMVDPKSLPTLDDAMRAKLRQNLPARNQVLLNRMRNRPKRKPRTTNKK